MGELKFNKRFGVTGLLFIMLLCFSSVAWAEKIKPRGELAKEEIRNRKEIFVDSDLTAGKVFWCGKKNTLIYHKEVGLFIYEVDTGKKVKVGNGYQSPLGCTPDGEWLVYEDKLSMRWDTDLHKELVAELWRFELKTGKRQKFMYANDGYVNSAMGAFFAPQGLKLYFANKPATSIEMPEPKWDIVWLERESDGNALLNKPTAMVGLRHERHQGGVLEIDVMSPYKKKIVMDSGFFGASFLMIDTQERIYMRTADDNFGHGWQTVRCSIDVGKVAISCESIFKDIMAKGHTYFGFDITNDGNFAVTSLWKDSCVRLRRIGESGGRCITSDNRMVGTKANVSPDEKWLAFTRIRHMGERDYHSDLYITEFKRD